MKKIIIVIFVIAIIYSMLTGSARKTADTYITKGINEAQRVIQSK